MKDSWVDVPVCAEVATTIAANPRETRAVPRNFCHFVKPSDRRRRTFVTSSRNPTIPNPTAASTSAIPDTVKRCVVMRDTR